MNVITVIPAYGRTYDNADDVIIDWENGLDFKDIFTNQYLSIRDTKEGKMLCEAYIYFQDKNGTVRLYIPED